MRCGSGAAPERCRCVVLHRNICGVHTMRSGAAPDLQPPRRSGGGRLNALRRRSGTAQFFCVTRKNTRGGITTLRRRCGKTTLRCRTARVSTATPRRRRTAAATHRVLLL
ncbi:hypothetical protein JYU34_021628 [Plutella xylostella]|uniref:Uncharacterized protein n=1 Tax=Plutella xylostella TaxID=51655 RepID=A0ABQ7PR35_PLUXY|nr:hypothetical protein JYU34_021628 [Plutella xylostella]